MGKEPPIRKTCQRFDVPNGVHALTFSCFGRKAFLARDRTREMFHDGLMLAKTRHGFHLWAYVVMPEHVHLLVWFPQEKYSVSKMLQTMKQSTARRAINYLRKHNPRGLNALATGQKHAPYHFWLDGGGYDRNIHSTKALASEFEYIHNNPAKRGLVQYRDDWYWSSAADWAEIRKGPIQLDKDSVPPH